MSLKIRNKNKQSQRPRPRPLDTYVRKSKYNTKPNDDNSNEISFSDDNNNSNNSDDIYLNEDNNTYFNNSDYNSDYNSNNSDNSSNNSDNDSDYSDNNYSNNNYSDNIYLFDDDNNSNYSDLSEDNNNSNYSDLSEDNNNSDIEMDILEETNFKNKTSLMMFTWITKHMIGNSAYKDLVNIINNENFNPIDIPKNIQTLKEQRKYLPLHKIKENIVNINKEKTSSNSQPTKISYSISILDHIRTILNNTQIASQLYFGPGIETNKKNKFWHGTIWQESPLFGKTHITIDRSKSLFIKK